MANMSTGLFRGMMITDNFTDLMLNGVIGVFSGAIPSNADAVPVGTLLGLITLNGDAFTPGSPTNGINFSSDISFENSLWGLNKATLETWKFTASANGTAGWFRHFANAADDNSSSTTLRRIDGTVGGTGSNADLILPTLTITTGMAKMTIDTYRIRRK
jgi:hypothetical protein